uniref:Uncharacterized protein n=1 Tax=Alexandrium monilatum TaxID=311494 RepID=A0A7S4UE14_9DINO
MSSGLVPDVGPAFPVVLPIGGGRTRGAGAAALGGVLGTPGGPTREEEEAVKELAEAGARADAAGAGEPWPERPGAGVGVEAEKPQKDEDGEAEAAMWKALADILRTRMTLQARAAEQPPVAGLNVALIPVTATEGMPPAGPGFGFGALPPPALPGAGLPLARSGWASVASSGDMGLPPLTSPYGGFWGERDGGVQGLGEPALVLLGPPPCLPALPHKAAWRPTRRRPYDAQHAPSLRAFL